MFGTTAKHWIGVQQVRVHAAYGLLPRLVLPLFPSRPVPPVSFGYASSGAIASAQDRIAHGGAGRAREARPRTSHVSFVCLQRRQAEKTDTQGARRCWTSSRRLSSLRKSDADSANA